MKVGDIVEYKRRQWYLYSLDSNGLCKIVAIRNGEITTTKNFGAFSETYLNANITNLPIEEIKPINNE